MLLVYGLACCAAARVAPTSLHRLSESSLHLLSESELDGYCRRRLDGNAPLINGLEPAQRTGNACFGYGEGDYTCCPSGVSKSCADGLCYTLWDQRAAAPILPHPLARSDQFEAHGLDPLKLQARERERRRRQRAGRLGGARHRAPHGPSAVDLAGQRAGRLRNHLRDASNYLCNTTCSLRVPPRARAAPRAASSLVNQATPGSPL